MDASALRWISFVVAEQALHIFGRPPPPLQPPLKLDQPDMQVFQPSLSRRPSPLKTHPLGGFGIGKVIPLFADAAQPSVLPGFGLPCP
jgi:hypothetical protein